jgi:hypothetical protein
MCIGSSVFREHCPEKMCIRNTLENTLENV